MAAIQIEKNAQTEHKLVSWGNGSALDDIFEVGSEKPMTCGFFTMTKHEEPFVYAYKYNELKLVVEGEMHFEDRTNNVKIVGKPGDTIRIEAGTTIAFSSPTFGKAFYVGQRKTTDC